MASCTCNPGAEEAETGGSLDLLVGQPLLLGKSQTNERLCLERKS